VAYSEARLVARLEDFSVRRRLPLRLVVEAIRSASEMRRLHRHRVVVGFLVGGLRLLRLAQVAILAEVVQRLHRALVAFLVVVVVVLRLLRLAQAACSVEVLHLHRAQVVFLAMQEMQVGSQRQVAAKTRAQAACSVVATLQQRQLQAVCSAAAALQQPQLPVASSEA